MKIQSLTGGTVSYFAAAAVRDADGWSAAEVSLTDAADLTDITDRLLNVLPDAEISLLFVEADDTYLTILRLDEGEDPRIFGSDVAFAEESRLGALLLGEVGDTLVVPPAADLTGPEPGVVAPLLEAEPAGDPDILADLGLPAERLLEICAHEAMLPSDMTAEICQAIGCGDEVEELREV